MTKSFKLIALLFAILIFASCKKNYTCKAKNASKEYIFKCENCKKDDVDAYKKEIEGKGYTDVTCEK
jgi:hypothetical protein